MTANLVRAFFYLSQVLRDQQHDPFCGRCKALMNSARNVREGLARFEAENGADIRRLSAELQQQLTGARTVLAGLVLPDDAQGQKKAGNCLMPQGVCFVKSSLSILEKI